METIRIGPWFRAARNLRAESKLGLAARRRHGRDQGAGRRGGPTAPIRDIGTEETRSLQPRSSSVS